MRALAFSIFLLSAFSGLAFPGLAFAQEGCDPKLTCDEAQLGAYAAPDFIMPKTVDPDAARGKRPPIPLFGLEDMVRVKPGSGLWLGEPVAGGNLFLNGTRNKGRSASRWAFDRPVAIASAPLT